MSELSKQALKVENNQQFPNNNAGLITPSNLRGFNEDMIDSTVNQATYTADSASFDSRINAISSSIDTGSLLVTASFNNGTRDLTFTKGDSSTFAVNIPDASGSVLPPGVVSGSSQIILTNTTGNLGGNRITGSVQSAISSSYAVTASFALNAGGADTGSLIVTASNDFSQITFTKGDASTFQLDVTPRRVVETVKNKNGFMAKGTPVYVSGSTGNELHVYAADAGDPTRVPATFILDQNLNTDESGLGILSGFINGVDTSLFAEGANIYLAVGGGYTDTQPTGSAFVQKLGNVVKSDLNGSGVISGAGRVNALPNIQSGYAWVGDGNGVPQAISTASWDAHADLTSLNAFTASQEILNNTFATTGSNNFVGNQDIDGSVTSSISLSNLIANPQTITDNVVVGPDNNGFIVGPTSISGTITVEGDSEVFVFSPPTTIDTSVFATTGSNTFTGGQTINGALTVNGFTSSFDQVKITDVFYVSQSAQKENRFQFANDGRLDVDWPAGNYFRMQNGAFQFGTNNGIGMFFDYPGIKFQPTEIPQNHAMAISSQPSQFPSLNFEPYTGSCAGIIYNQTNTSTTPTYLMVGAKYSSSFDETLYTDLSFFASGSLTASLEQGHVWVGNANGRTYSLPTSSFAGAGLGSNTFTDTQFITGSTAKNLLQVGSGTIVGLKVDTSQTGTNKVVQIYDSLYVSNPSQQAQIVVDYVSANLNSTLTHNSLSFTSASVVTATYGTYIDYNNLLIGNSNDINGVYFNEPAGNIGMFYGTPYVSSTSSLYLNTNDNEWYVTGSVNMKDTLNLASQNPLPAGAVGDLATSGSALYFHDGSSWRQVSLI